LLAVKRCRGQGNARSTSLLSSLVKLEEMNWPLRQYVQPPNCERALDRTRDAADR
jgi:hypothetical protein